MQNALKKEYNPTTLRFVAMIERKYMKRNCNNCKALTKHPCGIGYYCVLGYKTETINKIDGIPISYKIVVKIW